MSAGGTVPIHPHTHTTTTSTQSSEQVSLNVRLCVLDTHGENCSGVGLLRPQGRYKGEGKGSVTVPVAKKAGNVIASVGSRKKVFACPGRCRSSLRKGTLVTVRATARPTYRFKRMEGCKQRRGVCQVALRSPMTLTVVFARA
jgi:hypothetical protein